MPLSCNAAPSWAARCYWRCSSSSAAGKQGRRDVDAERRGGLEVDGEIKLRRRLHRQVARLGTLQDPVRVAGGAPEQIGKARPVSHESTGSHVFLRLEHSRQPVLCQELDDAADVKLVE